MLSKSYLTKVFNSWFERFFSLLQGIFVLSFVAFVALSLFSYAPFDESLNSSSTLSIQNRFNWPGSYTADCFMQSFGYASYWFLIILSFFPFVTTGSKKFFSLLLLSTICLSFALTLGFHVNGGFIAYFLAKGIKSLNISFLLFVFATLGIVLSFIFFGLALNKNLKDLFKILIKLYQNLSFAVVKLGEVILKRQKTVKRLETTKVLSDLVKDISVPKVEVIHKEFQIPEELLTSEEFNLPPIDLLDEVQQPKDKKTPTEKELQVMGELLQSVLEEFGIKGEIQNIRPGPVVTMFELKPAPGIKTSRVISLADDIARSMSALSARIAVIPGQNVIGIELPNKTRLTVFMKELLLSHQYQNTKTALPLVLGKDIAGEPIIADLTRMPHLLVAGTTGSGKSVSVNAMILSILFKLPPEKCRFIMVDPKMLELSIYNDIPHLLTPVVTDPKKAVVALKWAVKEMENRYQGMSKLGVRSIDGYNARLEEAKLSGEVLSRRVQTGFDPDSGKPIFETQNFNFEPLPYIIVVVDEMADLMLVAGKEIETAVQRLAQMARAAGIHLIMATQRPSVDVITGTIKANFPTRISFMVTSKIDSRTILGEQGAEQLLGQGDMLYMAGGGRIQRVHGPFMKDNEVERIVKFIKSQGEPNYVDHVTIDLGDDGSDSQEDDSDNDPVYRQAVDLIKREGKISTSFLQRHLSIGYNRAARIVDQMEAEGLVSAANHTGKREILV